MGKSYPDVLKEEGRQEGERLEAVRSRQQMLLRQLRRRFGDLPGNVVRAVENVEDVQQLELWLEQFAVATTLDEVGIVN